MLRSRLARLFLVAVLLGAAAAAAVAVRETHRQMDTLATGGRAASEHLARLEFLVAELQNAVAIDDGAVPSSARLTRAAGLAQRLRAEAGQLARLPASTRVDVAAVTQAGQAVSTALERATGYLGEGADLMAGDVLANDAVRSVAGLSSAVGRARTQQAETLAGATGTLVERATALTAGIAALVILGLAVLAVVPGRPRHAAPALPSASEQEPGLGLVTPPAPQSQPSAAPDDKTDLEQLADLCRDVAAASSPDDLPALLERTAALLGAHGVILWAASDRDLIPVAAHGYTASALRAMGRVEMGDGTPLSDACLAFHASAVPSGDGAPAALVVPLGTPGACRGILTAECRHATGFRADALAAARIAGSHFAAGFLSSGFAEADKGHSSPGEDVPLNAASA